VFRGVGRKDRSILAILLHVDPGPRKAKGNDRVDDGPEDDQRFDDAHLSCGCRHHRQDRPSPLGLQASVPVRGRLTLQLTDQ